MSSNFFISVAVLAAIIGATIIVVAYKSKRQAAATKCGCGKSETGLCDNSHAQPEAVAESVTEVDAPATGSNEYIKDNI